MSDADALTATPLSGPLSAPGDPWTEAAPAEAAGEFELLLGTEEVASPLTITVR